MPARHSSHARQAFIPDTDLALMIAVAIGVAAIVMLVLQPNRGQA
jgi:hypothetical protein